MTDKKQRRKERRLARKQAAETEKQKQVRAFWEEVQTKYDLHDWILRWGSGFRTLGRCMPRKKTILISKHHVEQSPWEELKDTVIHEAAHALCPGEHHSPVWRQKFISMGGSGTRLHMGVPVKRTRGWRIECPNACFEPFVRARRVHQTATCNTCKTSVVSSRYIKEEDTNET